MENKTLEEKVDLILKYLVNNYYLECFKLANEDRVYMQKQGLFNKKDDELVEEAKENYKKSSDELGVILEEMNNTVYGEK